MSLLGEHKVPDSVFLAIDSGILGLIGALIKRQVGIRERLARLEENLRILRHESNVSHEEED